MTASQTDVLIVGAGPTGLVLALWLVRQGVRVRLIDKAASAANHSRALAVQARTLELYRQLDLTDSVLARGLRVGGLNLWVRGRAQVRVPFEHLGAQLSPYGPLVFPQDEHERLLAARLESLGGQIERNTELIEYREQAAGVSALLRQGTGVPEGCTARYLAGCDGASSVVRRLCGARFPGGTYQQLFYVADVEASGPAVDGELHIDLDEADFLAIFPLRDAARIRLVGTIGDERAARADSLQFSDVSERAIAHMHLQVSRVHWFSTYRVHHRVSDRFRQGRAFLLGDAAHIHSPAGGQGMNTGIGDAINLAWKLAAVTAGTAPDSLLDTYQSERRAFARRLVATTDKIFTLATAEGALAGFIRLHIVPLLVPALFQLASLRTFLFSVAGQLLIEYGDSPLSEGKAGRIKGGDRLPWVRTAAGDNLDALRGSGWQVHVYGEPHASLEAWCQRRGWPLQGFAWQDAYARAGFARDAMYLLRPDGYVALAAYPQDPQRLERYLLARGLSVGRQPAVDDERVPHHE